MAAMAASTEQQQEASLPEMPSAVEMDFAETSECPLEHHSVTCKGIVCSVP